MQGYMQRGLVKFCTMKIYSYTVVYGSLHLHYEPGMVSYIVDGYPCHAHLVDCPLATSGVTWVNNHLQYYCAQKLPCVYHNSSQRQLVPRHRTSVVHQLEPLSLEADKNSNFRTNHALLIIHIEQLHMMSSSIETNIKFHVKFTSANKTRIQTRAILEPQLHNVQLF